MAYTLFNPYGINLLRGEPLDGLIAGNPRQFLGYGAKFYRSVKPENRIAWKEEIPGGQPFFEPVEIMFKTQYIVHFFS